MLESSHPSPDAASASRTLPQSLIVGTGQMAERIRNHPWNESTLGPIETWPSTLLTVVNMVVNSPTALAVYWGPEMIFLGNDESSRIIGPRHPDTLGLTARELWGVNWHQMQARFEAVLSSGQSFQEKSISVSFPRNGKPDEIFVDLTLSPIYHDGRIAGVLRSLREATEAVIAMRALAESNARLRIALSVGNGFGVWDWHIQTGMVYSDETAAKLYSIDPQAAAIGTSHKLYERMLHPDDIVVLSDAIMNCITTGKQYTAEYRVRRADGSYRRVQSMGRCVYDDQGNPCRVTGLKTEISGPKNADSSPWRPSDPSS